MSFSTSAADVLMTEAAEALTQQKLKPGLCAINLDKPLQYGEMACLLPNNDGPMKSFVDQWAAPREGDGRIPKPTHGGQGAALRQASAPIQCSRREIQV